MPTPNKNPAHEPLLSSKQTRTNQIVDKKSSTQKHKRRENGYSDPKVLDCHNRPTSTRLQGRSMCANSSDSDWIWSTYSKWIVQNLLAFYLLRITRKISTIWSLQETIRIEPRKMYNFRIRTRTTSLDHMHGKGGST